MMPYTTPRRLARRAAVALVAGAAALTAGCSDFLVAENPGAIEADELTDVGYVGLLTNGAMAAIMGGATSTMPTSFPCLTNGSIPGMPRGTWRSIAFR